MLKLIFSGGGTGGHIYPAIAVADEVRRLVPDADIMFVGAENRMEMQKVPQAGYKIQGLPVAGLQRRLTVDNLTLPFKVINSLRKSGTLLREFKPQAVAGFGGYASAPVLFMAQQQSIPTLIQEQNSYAGLTNKLLAKRVKRICVAYPGMEQFFPADKILFTGNPVRQDIADAHTRRAEAMAFYGLDPAKPVVLVIGGSLGARTLNLTLTEHADRLLAAGLQVIWQTGKNYYPTARALPTRNSLVVLEFINDMDLAYAAASMVVSRAGALSVSEICLTHLPLVLVPSPNVVADHQTKNARVLAEAGAAIMVSDVEAPTRLVDAVIALSQNAALQTTLRQNIANLARPTATRQIAQQLLQLAGYSLATPAIHL